MKWFSQEYKDDNIFQPLQIQHPENLKQIVDLLDGLQLTDINADVKGDAFEYFIRSYSASNPSDLGEIFTPRHIVKTVVKLLNPQIGEKVYDPFCGTGGMLIVAFKHIMANMARNPTTLELLRRHTIFGADLTKSASIAKMNMILAGDGHSNIVRRDSLRYPIDDQYDVLISNMPFSQKTRYGDKYLIPSRNADIICPQHCFRSLRAGGRVGLIVPDGFLSNKNAGVYEDIRRYLLENAVLKSVISLPRGAFEPYNRAKASILHFTDVKKGRTRGSFWFYDVQSDGYTLDKKRTAVQGENDLELVLSESNIQNQADEYLLRLGISRIDVARVVANEYVLTGAQYRSSRDTGNFSCPVFTFGELFSLGNQDRVGDAPETPVMSITMASGLIDQGSKFKKRIASLDISTYKRVRFGELVVGFPIDEGVLGFQLKYESAAVSPAYTIWQRTAQGMKVDPIFLELLLRSTVMRQEYRDRMQGAVDRRRSIPNDVFMEIQVPIPSVEVQLAVVAKHKEIAEANHLIRSREQDIQSAMTGLFDKGQPTPP